MPNGSFEGVDAVGPADWTLTARPQERGSASLVLDTATRTDGQRSLRLQVTGPATATAASKVFPVEANQPYLLSLRYRAEGMARGAGYEGASAAVRVVWFSTRGEIGSDVVGAPYKGVPWRHALRMAIAPAEASTAVVRLELAANAGAPPTRVWIDDIRFRHWSTRTAQNPKQWSWNAAERPPGEFRPVADDEAVGGSSVIAHPAHHEAGKYPFRGVPVEDLAPGAYRVDFRLKGAPDESLEPVMVLDTIGDAQLNMILSERRLTSSDFADSTTYRTFSLPFIKAPGGWVDFRVRWLGRMPIWVDTVTVTEEELIDERGFADVLAP